MGNIISLGEALVQMSDQPSKPVWIQIAKQGSFKGHAAGPFEMTETTFREIIRNFSAQKNQFIPIDFEHASEQAPTQGSIPTHGAPAQGWVTKLEIREDGNLWGLAHWGDLARKYIKSGQYRYLSPAIVFGSRDRVTGKSIGARLSSIGMTNQPFLDGLTPLAARHTEKSAVVTDVVKVIGMSLGLSEEMSTDDVLVIKTLRHYYGTEFESTKSARLREALRLPLTLSAKEVFHQASIACGAVQVSSPATPAAPDTKPPVTATQEESHMGDTNKEKDLEAQVSGLTLKLNAAEAETKTLKTEAEAKIAQLTAEKAELSAKVEAFETQALEARVDRAISIYGKTKGVTVNDRPHLMSFAKASPQSFDALYPPVPLGTEKMGQRVTTDSHNVPENRIPVEGGAQVINLKQIIEEEGIPSELELTKKLMSEDKSLSYDMAFSQAINDRKKMIKKATDKRLASNGG